MKISHSAGGVVINNDKVLVVSQHGKSWSLPKGGIEENENKLEAAKREIHEESGVSDLELIKELGSYERHVMDINNEDDKTRLKIIHMFLFKTNQTELKPVDPENPEAVWVEKEKVADLLTHRKDKEFFLSIKDLI